MVAENVPDGDFVRKLMCLSKSNKCGIIAGIAEIDGDKIYNTAVIIDRGSYVGKYRKIHLSDFEKSLFERGNKNGVFNVNGIKVGVQICFDLWFPEISREQMLESADLLCGLANFGGETTYLISQIRAIENLTPMVLCNRVGEEKSPFLTANFVGLSSIISSSGERIIPGRRDVEYAESCDVSLISLKSNIICDDFRTEILFHRT
jgi:predicted amidohydrolase